RVSTIPFEFVPIRVPIGTPVKVTLPPRVFRLRMTGLLFDTDKAFLLPSAMKSIRRLKNLYDEHKGLEVLVTGHTDTVGGPEHNLGLSEERAAAMAAFLADQDGVWLPFYSPGKKSKVWGTLEDQHMLSVLPQNETPFFSGTPNGTLDAE